MAHPFPTIYYIEKEMIAAKEIIDFLNGEILGISGSSADVYIEHLRPLECVDEKTLDWIGAARADKQTIAAASRARAILCDPEVKPVDGKLLIYVKDPKITIAKITSRFFVKKLQPGIHPSATIHPTAIIPSTCYIGPNCTLGECVLGDNCILYGNIYIEDHVSIGNNVSIQPGVVIGNEGHNFLRDEKNECVNFPHIGGVVIGDNVEIGGNSFISRGVLSNTTIGQGTKIAQLVYIGANVKIGKHCAIRPNVMISGSVSLNDYTIIAPSSTIRDQAVIGSTVTIGMGSVVTKDIPDGEVWFGNPARKKE